MQEKITAEFRDAVESGVRYSGGKPAGLEFVAQPKEATAGTWYAQRGLDTVLQIGYRFGCTAAGFELRGPAAEASAEITASRFWRPDRKVWDRPVIRYSDGEEIRGLLRLVRGAVAEDGSHA
jgi:hypothetical protein